MNTTKTITLTVELAQVILDYLATQPYKQVSGIIAELNKQASESLKPVAVEEKKD